MNENIPRDAANSVQAQIGSIQALLSAINDKVYYHLLGAPLPDPCKAVVRYSVGEIQELLAIAEGILHDMEITQIKVVRSFYGKVD